MNVPFSLKSPQCILKEPRYNGTFDLSGLQSTHAHTYSVPHAGDFTFNLCGGVNPTTCNGVAGTGACFKDAATGKERILGYASSNPVMRDSIIYFTFAGEKCAEKTDKNYTMEVMVECDYANEPDPISLIRVSRVNSQSEEAVKCIMNIFSPCSTSTVSSCCAIGRKRRACRQQDLDRRVCSKWPTTRGRLTWPPCRRATSEWSLGTWSSL